MLCVICLFDVTLKGDLRIYEAELSSVKRPRNAEDEWHKGIAWISHGTARRGDEDVTGSRHS